MTEQMTSEQHGSFSPLQVEYLLRGLNPARIAKLKGSNASYLTQEDVRAHATRLFGFGGWDCLTRDVTLVFEEQNEQGKWSVGYRVTQEVTVRDQDGRTVACYSETAVGGVMGPMPSRSDAHDFAVKNASSQAMKRCFINLGDQFGLGLYDKGSTARIVKGTLVGTGQIEVDDEPSPDNALPEPVPTWDSEQPVSETTQKVVAAAEQKHVEDDETFAAALSEIRVAAVIPDSSIRIAALAAIKGRYSDLILTRMTKVKDADVSLNVLIDRSSVGEFVPEEVKA